jgi:dUTP pyrophosphatase
MTAGSPPAWTCMPRSQEDVVIEPGAIVLVPDRASMLAIPEIRRAGTARESGLAVKHGISLPNTPATIDSDLPLARVRVPLINLGRERFSSRAAMRIAQFVVARSCA